MKKKFPSPLRLLLFALAAYFVVTGYFTLAASPSYAQEAKLTVRGSGLPVPRYVTLKFNEVNLRAGPGREYPVLWSYRKAGLPLLVEAEFGAWRKVVDHEGTTGWMRGSVLSLRRMVLVTNGSAKIYTSANAQSNVIAIAERDALLELQACPSAMCKVAKDGVRGWMKRGALWGVLATEVLD